MADTTQAKRFLVRLADGGQIGPMDKKAVRQMAKAGRLHPEDSIAAEGSDKWMRVAMVPGCTYPHR